MKKSKEDGPVKKSAKGVVRFAAIAVVAVVLFFRGFFFGGDGAGSGDGLWSEAMNIVDNLFEPTETPKESSKDAEDQKDTEDTKDQKDTEDTKDPVDETEKLPKVVIVTIQKDKVFVGDKEFDSAEALKKYIEEIDSDEREFKLKDEDSILATYEWVIKTFKDLKVQLVPIED